MAVAFKDSGAGVATETSGAALTPLCPATVDAGDVLIAHVFHEGTSNTPDTPSGWTLLSGPNVIETTIARHWVFGRVADGSEDAGSVAFGTAGGTNQRAAIVYSFSGRVSGTITQLCPAASFSHRSHATDPQMPTVTTTETGALAVALVGQNDNNLQVSATGETGGDWVEVLEFNPALTPGIALQLQTCTPTANPGTVTGGASATANDPVGVIGFEIRTQPGSQSKTLTPATESDAAQTLAFTKPIRKTITAATESDAAVALAFELGGAQEVALTPATETDTAQALVVTKPIHKALTAASEADTAQALAPAKRATLSPASEADSAQALSFTKPIHKSLTPATEADAAQALTVTKPIRKSLTAATETDTAQTVAFTKPLRISITPAEEIDGALTMNREGTAQDVSLIPATEADSAEALAFTKPIRKALTPATESDTALGAAFLKPIRVALSPASEADTALTAAYTKPVHVSITAATETDTARTMVRLVPVGVIDYAGGLGTYPSAVAAATTTDAGDGITGTDHSESLTGVID